MRRMENKTAVANKTLTLTCHVSGYPIEMITWSKGEYTRLSKVSIGLATGGTTFY